MTNCNPYENCPTFESEHFLLRNIDIADADDLLVCYADEQAVKLINVDRATTTEFNFTSVVQMRTCLRFWLMEYGQKRYVRFAIVDKELKKAVGTVEISQKGNSEHLTNVGLLRLDLATQYESYDAISELLTLINAEFYDAFGLDYLMTKAIAEGEIRIKALKNADYYPVYNNVIIRFTDDYFIKGKITATQLADSIGLCGLICAFCHKALECGGCGSPTNTCGRYLSTDGCYQYKCCKSENIPGCYTCPDICDNDMFAETHDKRNKAFVKFIKEYGKQRIAECLLVNQLNGIIYGWQRDYDNLASEQAVIDLLLKYQ